MIYFMVCGSEAAGRAHCRSRGWTQVGVDRFYTPERDDVRVVRRFTDIALLPGGTYMMAGPDYGRNAERGEFDRLVEIGRAQWVTGEEPKPETAVLTPVAAPNELEELIATPPAEPPFNPPLRSQEALKAQILGWDGSRGGSRGRKPYRR